MGRRSRWKESRVLKPDDSMCSRTLKMGACIRRNPVSESLNWGSPLKQRLYYNLRMDRQERRFDSAGGKRNSRTCFGILLLVESNSGLGAGTCVSVGGGITE